MREGALRLSQLLNPGLLGEKIFQIFTLEREREVPLDVHGRVICRELGESCGEPVVAEKLAELGFRPDWPRGRRFAVCLTHDVDWAVPPKRHVLRAVRLALRRGRPWLLPRWLLGSKLTPLNPYSVRRLAEIERRHSVSSTFFVKATPPDLLNPLYEEFYDLSTMGGELEWLIEEGWEVALHGGYDSYCSADRLKVEKQLLEKACGERVKGVRMHYLRFRHPDTWLAVEEAGFAYDSTLGFPDALGFRNGLCYPFKPMMDRKFLQVLEVPLAVMDTTLFGYLRLTPSQAFDAIRAVAQRVEALRGVLTLLWHNSSLGEPLYEGWGRLYRALLLYFSERGAWITSCAELCEYWEATAW